MLFSACGIMVMSCGGPRARSEPDLESSARILQRCRVESSPHAIDLLLHSITDEEYQGSWVSGPWGTMRGDSIHSQLLQYEESLLVIIKPYGDYIGPLLVFEVTCAANEGVHWKEGGYEMRSQHMQGDYFAVTSGQVGFETPRQSAGKIAVSFDLTCHQVNGPRIEHIRGVVQCKGDATGEVSGSDCLSGEIVRASAVR